MCDSCEDRALDLILDYILLGLHLEVSVALARDSIVQHVVMSAESDEDAIDDIRHFTVIVADQAQKLRDMSNEIFRDLLIGRAMIESLS